MKGSGWGMGWYYFCGRKFLQRKKKFVFCEIVVRYCNKEERWDNFLIVQTEFTLDLNPYPFDLK